MSREVWRIVPSAPFFMASNQGRIMVIPYMAPVPHGGERQYGGLPHFGVWNKQDERFVVSYKNRNYKIARLVCEAFKGPPPFKNAVCMHIDENSANNRANNLKWGSQKENMNAEGYIQYCRSRTGDNSPTTKHRMKNAIT